MSGIRYRLPSRKAPDDGTRSAPRRSVRVILPPEEKPRPIDPNIFPERVCQSCQKITLHGLLNTSEDSREEDELYWLDYDRDLPTNCPLCSIIFNSISRGNEIVGRVRVGLSVDDRKPENDIYSVRQIRQVLIRKCWGGNAHIAGGGEFRIYAEPNSHAAKFVPSRRAPSSNLSDSTFEKIIGWIKDCDETHTACQGHFAQASRTTTRYLPTRVVHVGSATRQPHLHISQPQQNDRYIALSHCWGKSLQVRTLNENIEQFKEEIIFDNLSKTFQDAIRVTRRLGIEYIWIDSLCIVQDDKNDWLQESERMGAVYANAYITLAATWAADGSGGLDSTRPSSNWIKFPCDGSDEAKGHMWFTDASWTSQTDIDKAPLNTRGWVFQEKMLSRRIIHFTFSQVYWECKKRFVGEEFEDKIHFLGKTLEPSQFWADVNTFTHVGSFPIQRTNDIRDEGNTSSHVYKFYNGWRALAPYYCTLQLTKASDRLIALLGIIRVVEKQTGFRCVDGHWDDGSWRFVRELMWLPKGQKTMSLLSDNERSRLCSSWSWASLEGPIEHYYHTIVTWQDYDLKDCSLYLEAIESKVDVPWPSHPLLVSGMLRTVYKGEYGGSEYPYQSSSGRRTFIVTAEESGKAVGWVCFDLEDKEPEQFYVTPLYLCDSGFRIACLALIERHGTESRGCYFERVGVGHIEVMIRPDGSKCGDMELFETCERSAFCII
ncbi:heterokaryon incompatibility protein-domain-containing protein [Pyrenochaeta sp. MPI-SDFR-AT-0127]|nr:heterokaryon incompatibility protein-domain-containing protein [Pyrenochaeta sp. MPI-SDFR-AT-0127]